MKTSSYKFISDTIRKPFFSIIISILLGFIISGIILLIFGYNPIETIESLMLGLFGRPKFVTNIIIKSAPLILTGLSVAFSFKAGLFNIGAEGQYIVGSLATTIVGLSIDFPPYIQIPILILVGIVSGGIWGGLAGLLKAKFSINEVIGTIMLNFVALHLSNYICMIDKFHQPNTNGTYPINKNGLIMILNDWKLSKEGISMLKDNKILNDILLKTDLNFGILISIACVLLIWLLLYKTTSGYEIRSVGLNMDASRCAGININKNIICSMSISGALAGLSGAISIMGLSPHCTYLLSIFEGNGFNALAVALIAKCSPIGCIFSGLLFSGLSYSGRFLQLQCGTPSEIVNIVIGIIILFISASNFMPIVADKIFERGANK